MDIYEIKRRTQETSPYFFSKETLKFFGQTMKDFRVAKLNDGRFYISAKCKAFDGTMTDKTERIFNPVSNELEEYTEEIKS